MIDGPETGGQSLFLRFRVWFRSRSFRTRARLVLFAIGLLLISLGRVLGDLMPDRPAIGSVLIGIGVIPFLLILFDMRPRY